MHGWGKWSFVFLDGSHSGVRFHERRRLGEGEREGQDKPTGGVYRHVFPKKIKCSDKNFHQSLRILRRILNTKKLQLLRCIYIHRVVIASQTAYTSRSYEQTPTPEALVLKKTQCREEKKNQTAGSCMRYARF